MCCRIFSNPPGDRTQTPFSEEIALLNSASENLVNKREVLRNLDCFVLDNTIRETAVAAYRGSTIEDKWKLYRQAKRCGMKHLIVAAFTHMKLVDDDFIIQLRDQGEDFSTLYAFTEVSERIENGRLDSETIPFSLQKMKSYGLRNPVIEIDLASHDNGIDWENKYTVEDFCKHLLKLIEWVKENLSREANVFVSTRDLAEAMREAPERVLKVVQYLANLPEDRRPFGFNFEDASGKVMPEELGLYTSILRRVMNENNWHNGHILVHIHEKWGLAATAQLACLSNGASGIWAALSEEGAGVGHACSTVTLMNLIRLGNKIVLKNYNCTELRSAAAIVTEISTGLKPYPTQIIYGERALDFSFDFGGIAGGRVGRDEFDMGGFFHEKRPVRISTLATPEMILAALVDAFGKDPHFTIERAEKMHATMMRDLEHNRKEDYTSKVGLALLFDKAGGKITTAMEEIILKMKSNSAEDEIAIKDVRKLWDHWAHKDKVKHEDCLPFDSFYHGFMIPYFGCYRCSDTRKALQAIDMDNDGFIEWSEFLVFIKWALYEYPGEISNVDNLLSVTFRKGIIPAMQDEIVKENPTLSMGIS